MELVIGNKNYSSWSLRPWMLMRYFALDFSERHIGLRTPQMKAQMAPLCPNYKVPVLLDQGQKIWDSLAICEYISEQYLSGKGWPSDPLARAQARSICAEMHSGFNGLRNQLPMNCRRKVGAIPLDEQTEQDVARVIEVWGQCLQDNPSEAGFLFGDFSIADAYYMPVVSRFNSYQIEVPEPVQAYMQRMLSLDCYQQWLDASHSEKSIIEAEEV